MTYQLESAIFIIKHSDVDEAMAEQKQWTTKGYMKFYSGFIVSIRYKHCQLLFLAYEVMSLLSLFGMKLFEL